MSKVFYFAGWLLDGTESPAKQNVLFCVENGRISSLEKAKLAELKQSGLAFEAYQSCTILPGLVDSHVHLTMSGQIGEELRSRQLFNKFEQNEPLIRARIEKSLACGIMALRDGGDLGGHTHKHIVENGISHVSVKSAGRAWHAPGRYGKIIGRAPENGLTLAESIKANCEGIDHIKIINSGLNSLNEVGRQTPAQFHRDELDEAFQTARILGLKIMVHANGKLPVKFAVEAGCDSIEHGFFMGEENMKRIADRQVFWVPTAFPMKAFSMHNPESPQSQAASRILEAQLEQMGRARKLGVNLAAGTDAGAFGVRHGMALAEELKLMMDAGFSIEETICCATSLGARLLGVDHELGRLVCGMPANFVVVDGPPSGLPDSLREIKAVYVRGKKIGSSENPR